MRDQNYGPTGLKSNTPALEPAYNADRLKTDPAYRYRMVDEFTAYLNGIVHYADRARYYLHTTVAMGLPIPDFYAGLTVNVFEGGRPCKSILSLSSPRPHVWCIKRYERNWKPQNAGTHTPKGELRDLPPVSSPKEWTLSPRDSRERGILCKEWFKRIRHSRFPHLIFNERNEYREWINETIDERKARFEQQVVGREHAAYTKTESIDIQHEMVQFLQDFATSQNKRDWVLTQKHNLANITNTKAREQQQYKPEANPLKTNQPFDLIRKELAGKNGINWSVFTTGGELECFGILWGMVKYWQWLEAGAIELVGNNNNVQSTAPQTAPQSDAISNTFLIEQTMTNFKFTVRQAILYLCYEGKLLIESKQNEKHYNDYIKINTTAKRIGYPNDSSRKAKLLIKDIQEVKKHLSKSNTEQADNEIDKLSEINY